ncbi:MAG: hypothetical protein JWM02_3001 [Frankiales bacterium]|nr:hypothetical protein [Frankiales bacterium]
MYCQLARYDGYCAGCDDQRPLVLMEQGPHGLRAWLAGAGPEDRPLAYTCALCGRVEYVPPTEADDAEYEATLTPWGDGQAQLQPVAARVA